MFLSFLVIVLSCVARTLTRARISDVLLNRLPSDRLRMVAELG